jgi:hypothetical protein
MNYTLIERVENDAVEPEYQSVTLRLLQGELWTVKTGLYSNPGDQELRALRDRLHRAIEKMDERIYEFIVATVRISQQHQIL